MSEPRVTCPHCEATLALGAAASAGKNVRCPKCGETFPLSAEEAAAPAAKPRSFRPKRSRAASSPLPLILCGALLLAGVAAGGVVLLKSKHGVKKDVVPAAGIGTNVGQLVKEIAAEDIDGTPFKLSDYRGKVVVLDFWGHW